jgi:two-component sensor histidine kinase
VLKQDELFVYTDPETAEMLGIIFPESLSNIAKPAKFVQ